MLEGRTGVVGSGTIAVAMSGGVDSSVAAARLVERGAQVLGVTALMLDEESRCCSSEDIQRAERVAAKLGISHHVIDVRQEFRRDVLEPFTAEYLAGRTPSPCAICNLTIKFGALLDAAHDLGATALATGHYARNDPGEGGVVRLRRAEDRTRDQSYFLARLTQSELGQAVFPLGRITKQDVLERARRSGLEAAIDRESRELCFVTRGKHGDWINVRCLKTPGPGYVEDTNGNRIGRHAGIHHYTVGQRKGLGVALGYPVYVTAIDAPRNVIVVGSRAEAMRSRLRADRLHWISGRLPAGSFRAEVQIRYNQTGAAARVELQPDGTVEAVFDEPQFAVTPGQLAVFYSGDEVLGSGWIVPDA